MSISLCNIILGLISQDIKPAISSMALSMKTIQIWLKHFESGLSISQLLTRGLQI